MADALLMKKVPQMLYQSSPWTSLLGAQQFSSGEGQFYQENVNFYWNLAKGTTAKAQGTTAIAVGAVG